jgi:hypothetical protein
LSEIHAKCAKPTRSAGGWAIRLAVADTLRLDGLIGANGGYGAARLPCARLCRRDPAQKSKSTRTASSAAKIQIQPGTASHKKYPSTGKTSTTRIISASNANTDTAQR